MANRNANIIVQVRSGQASGELLRLTGLVGGLRSAFSGLGVAIGVRELVSFGKAAGASALELDHTLRVTKEVAGSSRVYTQIISEARAQQALFGGTLAENVEGLSGLAVTSKNTGAALNQLVDIQKRLTILNPAQGATGGLIALNEALAGNISSLQRRFNIPRSELQKLSDTSVPVAERLRVIDQFLNKVGITSAAVSRSVSDTAKTYNTLAAEADNAKVATGNLLANLFKFPAKITTTVLVNITGNLNAGEDLQARIQANSAEALRSAKGWLAYADAQNQANQATSTGDLLARRNTGLLVPLTASQFAYAQSLINTGQSAEDALAKTQQYADTIKLADATSIQFGQSSTTVANRLIALAGTSDQNRQTIDALIASLDQIGSTQAIAAINAMEAAQRAQMQATLDEEREQRRLTLSFLDGVPATNAYNQALAEQTQKMLGAKVETQDLDRFQRSLASISNAVRDGHLSAADGAAFLAKQYNITKKEAADLLSIQAQLANISPNIGGGTVEQGGDALNRFLTAGQRATQFSVTQAAAAQAAKDAQILAIGTDKEKLSLLQQQYATAVKLHGVSSAEAITAQTALKTEQQRQAAAGRRGASKGLSALDKDSIALAGDLQAQLNEVNKQLERGNLTQHQRNQLLIRQADLQEKIAALEERTADSVAKQARARLDAARAILDNEKQLIVEEKERRIAENAARNAKDPRIRRLAELKAQDIPLEQAQRLLDIQEKLATAGGQIVNGRIIQGQRGGLQPGQLPQLPPIGPIPQVGSLPALPTLPGAAGGIDVRVFLDSDQIAAKIEVRQRAGLRSAVAGGV